MKAIEASMYLRMVREYGAARQSDAIRANAERFVSNQTLKGFLVAALSTLVLVGIAQGVFDLVKVVTLNQVRDGMVLPLGEAQGLDDWTAFFALVDIVVLGMTALLFVVWLYRAIRNLRTFGAVGLGVSPSWAIWCWFVPIFNLWAPYQAMREVWRASASGQAGAAPPLRRNAPVHPLLGWWWGAVLPASFSAQVAIGTFGNAVSSATFADLVEFRGLAYVAESRIDTLQAQAARLVIVNSSVSRRMSRVPHLSRNAWVRRLVSSHRLQVRQGHLAILALSAPCLLW
jgi:hypothetical protein